MIVRIQKRENPYAQIDKRPLFDKRLSYKARGILSYLLAKPDNWNVRIEDLIENSPDGRDSIQSGLKELKEYGYAVLETSRDKSGQITGKEWVIYETPMGGFSARRLSPISRKPVRRKNRRKENPPNNNNEKKDNDNTVDSNESTASDQYTFDQFWHQYAHKVGSKKKAYERFSKLNLADREAIRKTLPLYLRETVTSDDGRRSGKFRPLRKHPCTFLNDRTWETYLDVLAANESADAIPTEHDTEYQSYLNWVEQNFPCVLEETKHMSKSQFITYKTKYYVEGKSMLSRQIEFRYLTEAHEKINSDVTARHSYPDVFALHCEYVRNCVKSHTV